MALTDEQRAMMRMLAQRDVGYEDVAALMGITVDEVEARVDEAVTAMEEDGDGSAAAAASPPTPRSPRTPRPSRRSLPRPRPSIPAGRRRIVFLAAGALALVSVALLVTYLVAGSNSISGSGPSASEGGGAARNITQADLEPVGAGDAHGRALFGRISNTAVLQVQAEGLEPSLKGKSYTVWLYRSPKLALRVGAVKVGKSGRLGAQFPLPNQLLSILAGGAFDRVNVTLTDDSAYRREISNAKREKRLPAYSGKTVLSGDITGPLVEQQG